MSDCVGRKYELDKLSAELREAAGGAARCVVLSGGAGVGKSHLLQQFAASARSGGAHVLWGECIAFADGAVPYAPLVDALRRLGREFGAVRLRALTGAAYQALADRLTDVEDADPGATPGSARRLFGMVLELLEQIGLDAPVVLVLEDLHWADDSTLDMIKYLTRVKSTERLMLVCSYRAEEVAHDSQLWQLLAEPEFLRRQEAIVLPGFSLDELREFLSRGSPVPVPMSAVRNCFTWSRGNAFYAKELMVGGALDDPTQPQLPDSLSASMLARFHRLGDDARHLTQVAAIAGRRMSGALLEDVSGLEDVVLDAALDECERAHILVADRREGTYAFCHALMREAVYGKLQPTKARRLHRRMAEALARDPRLSLADDLTAAAELALHWYRANVADQAFAAAARAASAAWAKRAFNEAEIHYRRMITLWPAAPDGLSRRQVLVQAADAARWAGHPEHAVELIGTAIAEAGTGDGELHERLGSYLWEAGDREGSGRAYEQAATLLEGDGPSAVLARVLASQATTQLRAGRYSPGLDQAEQAVGMARAVGAKAEEGRALNTAGLARTMLGEPDVGIGWLREALEIARSLDHLEDLYRAYGNLGLALELAGRLREAVEVLREGLDSARALGLGSSRQGTVLANNTSAALLLLGEWDDAARLIDDELLDRPPKESLYPRLTLAEIEAGRRAPAARRRLDEIGDSEQMRDPRFSGPLHACRAELALWDGELVVAAEEVTRGLAAIGDSESPEELLRLCVAGLRVAAEQSAADGDRQTALAAARHLADLAATQSPGAGSADGRRRVLSVEARMLMTWCESEFARVVGTATAGQWAATADGWEAAERVHPAAYARLREAELALASGDKTRALAAAQSARRTAERLGAVSLVDAADEVIGGVTPTTPRTSRPFGLTRREAEVLRLLCEDDSHGATNITIARELGIQPKTVEEHATKLYRKMRVSGRQAAIIKAVRAGLA